MIGDSEYEINSDFRISILFEILMQDEDVDDTTKVIQALELYFPEYPEGENVNDVFNALLWFYRCGRSTNKRKRPRAETKNDGDTPEEQEDNSPQVRAYSFDYDDEYIYAAFLQQYGINLTSVKYLHWWEFRAMFKGLDHNCEFAKIMGYRTAKITKEMSNTEKAFLRKMKTVHALPMSEKQEREENALIDALMNGGDVEGLLGYKEAAHEG